LKEEEEKHKEEEKKKVDDEEEKDVAALGDEERQHHKWAKVVKGVHKDSENRLKLKRLSAAEKTELFKTIRFSFMKHEELLALTMNPTFELAKQCVIEGLSVRLNPYENGIKEGLTINIEPRANYDPTSCTHVAQNPATADGGPAQFSNQSHPGQGRPFGPVPNPGTGNN